jgi:hypothetical protein
MEKTLQTLSYLSRYLARLLGIGLLCAVGSVVISDWIFYSTGGYSLRDVTQTLPYEFIAALFALIAGGQFFVPHFKVALANGISRKTFLLACLPGVAAFAAALAIFSLILAWAHSLFWPAVLITHLFYPFSAGVGIVLVQFTLYFLLAVLGCFTAVLLYRAGGLARWAFILTPLALYIAVRADGNTGGHFFTPFNLALRVALGLRGPLAPNAYIASLTLFLSAALICGLVYLLLRRAPIKAD